LSVALPFDSDAATAEKWHSPDFCLAHRARRKRQFKPGFGVLSRETIADPEEVSSFERWRQSRYRDYFGSRQSPPQDPRNRLPVLPEDTVDTLALRYGTSEERRLQALALARLGLRGKAKRLALCGRLGHRINHQTNHGACHRKFFELYFCREKYCTFCGPQQFREQFAKLQNALTPTVERLLSKGTQSGHRQGVTAGIDFTIPNKGRMPTSLDVREFHAKMRQFYRLVERVLRIKRSEYGVVRCDEVGGNNTNLHAHCAYVGPWLPQKMKELSALWSVVWIAKSQRRRELLRFVRKHGLEGLWLQLAPHEQRFVSIKLKSFPQALAHALQYPVKFIERSKPERLAQLERTFHKTRRVSTGGVFYRLKELREPGDDTQFECQFCPYCKVRLVTVHEGWQPLSSLESEGRINLRAAEHDASRRNVFACESPP
jgi:hypothetical protein